MNRAVRKGLVATGFTLGGLVALAAFFLLLVFLAQTVGVWAAVVAGALGISALVGIVTWAFER